jgi:Rrf2 family nitric oxide-sensitive transcriptional repressor
MCEMQLNLTTDYAIRAMVYLAEEGHMVTGVEIANKMQIPSTYLVTIMKSLREAGFVSVKRGKVGGYALAKPADQISLWDIMVVMEGTMQLDGNIEHDLFSNQQTTGMGQVRRVYRSLQQNLEKRLRAVTLEHLISDAYEMSEQSASELVSMAIAENG